MTSDVVTMLEDADASRTIDAPTDDLLDGLRFLLDRDVAVDDLQRGQSGELEASDRRDVA
jgi:hypothetical protein